MSWCVPLKFQKRNSELLAEFFAAVIDPYPLLPDLVRVSFPLCLFMNLLKRGLAARRGDAEGF